MYDNCFKWGGGMNVIFCIGPIFCIGVSKMPFGLVANMHFFWYRGVSKIPFCCVRGFKNANSKKGFAFNQSITGSYIENDKMAKTAYKWSIVTPQWVSYAKMMQTYVLFQLAVTFPKSKMAAISQLVFFGLPIDPIHDFCTIMDFLTQITYILRGLIYSQKSVF